MARRRGNEVAPLFKKLISYQFSMKYENFEFDFKIKKLEPAIALARIYVCRSDLIKSEWNRLNKSMQDSMAVGYTTFTDNPNSQSSALPSPALFVGKIPIDPVLPSHIRQLIHDEFFIAEERLNLHLPLKRLKGQIKDLLQLWALAGRANWIEKTPHISEDPTAKAYERDRTSFLRLTARAARSAFTVWEFFLRYEAARVASGTGARELLGWRQVEAMVNWEKELLIESWRKWPSVQQIVEEKADQYLEGV